MGPLCSYSDTMHPLISVRCNILHFGQISGWVGDEDKVRDTWVPFSVVSVAQVCITLEEVDAFHQFFSFLSPAWAVAVANMYSHVQ